MIQIMITIWDKADGKLEGMTEIESEECVIQYSSTKHYHGLQCLFDGDTPEFKEILDKCSKLSNIANELVNYKWKSKEIDSNEGKIQS